MTLPPARAVIDLPDEADSKDLIIVILVGTAEEIRLGQGSPCITTTQAAAKIGVSIGRFMSFVKERQIVPVARYFKSFLFKIQDVNKLKAEREAKYAEKYSHTLPKAEDYDLYD